MHVCRSKLSRSLGRAAWLAASGWLVGCSLVTEFERHQDAARSEPDIEAHDAAVSTPDERGKEDAALGEQPVDAGAPSTADAAALEDAAADDVAAPIVVDAGAETAPDAATGTVPDAAALDAAVLDAAAPTVDPDPVFDPDPIADSGVGSVPDAGAMRPSVKELIDAVGGERDGRTARICACPGAGQECVRAGFGKSSCLELGIMLLAGTSEEAVRSLLECMLPVEQAYTACVERRLNCRNLDGSLTSCGTEYDRATARCNVGSIQGLTLQRLCAR